MGRSPLCPEKKAGGLKAISRSVTEGNHRNNRKNNSRALVARSENNQYTLRSLFMKAERQLPAQVWSFGRKFNGIKPSCQDLRLV